MNTENCWFCNTPLDGDVALYNHHVVHSDCMNLGWVPVAVITDEGLKRYVETATARGYDDEQERLDDIFRHVPYDQLKADNVYVLGMGETKELDWFGYDTSGMLTLNEQFAFPDVTLKEKIYAIALEDGWRIIPVDSFVNVNNGQHYIHGSICK